MMMGNALFILDFVCFLVTNGNRGMQQRGWRKSFNNFFRVTFQKE
jgi:hypothetical protein